MPGKKRHQLSVLRKYEEKRLPMILLNPYKQIGSSFVLNNNDRFGEPYAPLKRQNELPGPGWYNLQGAFPQSRSRTLLGVQNRKALSNAMRQSRGLKPVILKSDFS